jgi:hypothetical protein
MRSFCAGKLSGFPNKKTSRQHMFVASQNKLLQSYVDQTVTITKSFQPHLPLYVATVDGRGGRERDGTGKSQLPSFAMQIRLTLEA